jgi:transposase-like protein
MTQLVEQMLNQVLEAQMSEHIGAARYERSPDRQTYRNGHRLRQLTTRVGRLTLRVPQTRDGSFSTELFARYQRSEQALVLALIRPGPGRQMTLQGVSTRKVTKITEELCGTSFSPLWISGKSTVSRLCQQLDARVSAWRERPLGVMPFVVVDALVVKVRRDEAVRSTSALIALGVNTAVTGGEEGYREVLGLWLGDSESEGTWSSFFRSLKERGLSGVDLIVSDNHTGLVKAAQRHFQGAQPMGHRQWQRCQVHLMRNVLALVPKRYRSAFADGLRRLFRSEDKAEARAVFAELVAAFEGQADRALDVLESGLEDALAVLVLPERYRRRLRTTNMCERLNEELRRRERVIRIFPNDASAMRLLGALLAEQHETWVSGKRYFDMTAYRAWKVEDARSAEPKNVIKTAA